jgi:hypothetical protein
LAIIDAEATPRLLPSGCEGLTTVTNGMLSRFSDRSSSGTSGSDPMTPMLQFAIENRFDDAAEGLHVEAQRRVRVGLSAVHCCPRQCLHRVHHVHSDGELGLEPLTHGAGPGLEFIDVARH